MYYAAPVSKWAIGPICGSQNGISAYGNAGLYPFSNTATNWNCAPTNDLLAVEIECELYKNQAKQCVAGTYNATSTPPGYGIEGRCHPCPAHLSHSLPGASSLSSCFTLTANLYAVSEASNRVTQFSADESAHALVLEGDQIRQPKSLAFISPTLAVIALHTSNIIVMMTADGAILGDFAEVGNPVGLLYLPTKNLLAASDVAIDTVHFFNPTTPGSPPVASVEMAGLGATSPLYLAVGESESEVLVSTHDRKVGRFCVPDSPQCKPQLRNRILVYGGMNLRGIVALPTLTPPSFLLCDHGAPGQGDASIYVCPLDAPPNTNLHDGCGVWAHKPEGEDWAPQNLLLDTVKQIVYVADQEFSVIHVFSIFGDYFGHLEEQTKFLSQPTALAIKPGPLAALSLVTTAATATAGDPIAIRIALRTSTNDHLPAEYDVGEDLSRFKVKATGMREESAASLEGEVTSADEARVFIKYAGVWEISITEGIRNPQHLMGSPLKITVEAGETEPSECEAEYERVLTAGASFSLDITTTDAYSNPTTDASFSCSCCCGETMTDAGEYTVHVAPPIKGSPFRFDVKPGAEHAATSTHTTNVGAESLELRVFPKDEFNNTVTDATGYIVSIDGGDDIPLSAPDFSHTHAVKEGSFELSFKLDGVDIQNSPVKVVVMGANADGLPVGIMAAGMGGLLVLFGLIYWRQRRKGKKKVMELEGAASRMENKNEELVMENELLEYSLRQKKHTLEEQEVIKFVLDNTQSDRVDELRSVMIDSSEIEVEELLGQGGMGKVHLALYKGARVAVKQLLAINEENVTRFRFECFLTKVLIHPNCVRMVGVCWDERMLGCVMEYVDGGSLQGRLTADWGVRAGENIGWKNELLKWATEAALGVQYLHHTRYFDETEGEWKDCVVHRDLKPDNMLVTTNGVLKLTDFGEARAAELNMTMTAVGTPIYVCPEIIRNERYDTKADTYSYGIVLVAMMRSEDTIINFFFNALLRKMGKKTRAGVGLNALNINVAEGWRPSLPEEFYPGMIQLIWRCWDDDPAVRPDFDEIVGLLMGDLGHEIRSNEEPIFGSGKVIGKVAQIDKMPQMGERGGISLEAVEKIIADKDMEIDQVMRERDQLLKELREEVQRREARSAP